MLKVLDVFQIGNMLSVTLGGDCRQLCNGSKLKDKVGNIITVNSIAMTRPDDLNRANESTTILTDMCDIGIGLELSIA